MIPRCPHFAAHPTCLSCPRFLIVRQASGGCSSIVAVDLSTSTSLVRVVDSGGDEDAFSNVAFSGRKEWLLYYYKRDNSQYYKFMAVNERKLERLKSVEASHGSCTSRTMGPHVKYPPLRVQK